MQQYLNNTETVGATKHTSIAGNVRTFITGELTEIIEKDVHSETKQGKTVVNSDQGMETFSSASINRHAENEVQQNSGEKSKNH